MKIVSLKEKVVIHANFYSEFDKIIIIIIFTYEKDKREGGQKKKKSIDKKMRCHAIMT